MALENLKQTAAGGTKTAQKRNRGRGQGSGTGKTAGKGNIKVKKLDLFGYKKKRF